MAWGNGCLGLMALAGAMLVAGCTQTTQRGRRAVHRRRSLNQTRKAVAVMRVGAASPYCINVAVLLGVRDGEGFRRHQGITVMNVRSLDRAGGGGGGARSRRVSCASPTAARPPRAASRPCMTAPTCPASTRTSLASFVLRIRRDRQRRLPACGGLAGWPRTPSAGRRGWRSR